MLYRVCLFLLVHNPYEISFDPLLKWWPTHAEYQLFLSVAVTTLNDSQLKRFYSYSDSLDKLSSLNLDPVGVHLLPYYSDTGRPALNQPQILRSFILMLDQGFTSLTVWVKTLQADDLLAFMIDCHPDSLPPLGSYYDFIDRLWLRNPAFEKSGRKDVFPCDKNKKPSTKPGKDKKLPNRHSGITKKIADHALTGEDFPFHYEKLLQELFPLAAIVPSMELGLIPPKGVTVSGDGTCVHTHSNPYGHKICDCSKQGESCCSCDRHFSDPDAAWGWDSDLNSNRGRPASIPDRITIDTDGTPLCQAGFRMVYWGYCKGRSRCKWRCPVACGKEENCSCKDDCSPSPYGRCIYTKPDWDIRLYPPVARGTAEYRKTYNNRSGSERVNDRILNNYHLHAMNIHSKKRYSFFAMIAGINIHLDARLKKQKMDAA